MTLWESAKNSKSWWVVAKLIRCWMRPGRPMLAGLG
jgi:hypothetical protein